MTIPRSSADYYRRQQRIIAKLLLAVRQAWRRMETQAAWSEQYAEGIGAQLAMLVAAAQVAAARDADAYIGAVLAELGLAPAVETGVVAPAAFAGVAGDGRRVESLLGLAVPRAGQIYNARRAEARTGAVREQPDEMSDALWDSLLREERRRIDEDLQRDLQRIAEQSLADVGRWLEAVAAAVVIDAARAAESAALTARPEVEGYVRMLNPPSCSRCVVLAGKFYRWNAGFDRHPPTCDCRHIPANEAIAGDLTVNPSSYFESLTRAEQDRIFTQSGARAIRDGADISQVVNARRGMERAQDGAHAGLLITRDSTTRRGRSNRGRTGRNAVVRLMPESIYDVASDRADAIRLLRLNGFLT